MARIGVAYVEITGDLTKLNQAIIQVDEKLKRVSRKEGEPKLGLNTKDFDLAHREGLAKLARLEKKKARALLTLDTHGLAVAERQIAAVEAELQDLERRRRIHVEVDVDRSAIRNLVRGGGGVLGELLGESAYKDRFVIFAAGAASAAGALNVLAASATALGAALAPLTGLLAAIPSAMSGAAQAGGALFATFSGIGEQVRHLKLSQMQQGH